MKCTMTICPMNFHTLKFKCKHSKDTHDVDYNHTVLKLLIKFHYLEDNIFIRLNHDGITNDSSQNLYIKVNFLAVKAPIHYSCRWNCYGFFQYQVYNTKMSNPGLKPHFSHLESDNRLYSLKNVSFDIKVLVKI